MASLNDNELRAVAYYSIGVSSEGEDVAYQLSFAGRTVHEKDGSVMLRPVANSGYSVGTLQTDFGAHPEDARAHVDSFQVWQRPTVQIGRLAINNRRSSHPNWVEMGTIFAIKITTKEACVPAIEQTTDMGIV